MIGSKIYHDHFLFAAAFCKFISRCDLDFDDLNAEKRTKYDGFEVYKQSKLAAAMFAKELSEKVKGNSLNYNIIFIIFRN